MLQAYAWFFECFYFYFSLVFYILGAFLRTQLLHSRLLDMRWLQPTQRYAPRWLAIYYYPTRARAIIVNEQKMVKDKTDLSMFSRQMEAIVFIILQIYF